MTVRPSPLLLALLVAGRPALAAGLYLPESGTQAQSRAGAFVARADDATALVLNPAGLAKTTGTEIYLGAGLVDYHLSFARTGAYEPTLRGHSYEGRSYPRVRDQSHPAFGLAGFQAIPLLAVTSDLGLTLPIRVGGGLYAPTAYPGRDLPTSYALGNPADPAPAPQRYDVQEQSILAVMPSLAVSWAPLSWLSVGARATWGVVQFASRTSVWGVRNHEETPSKDGVIVVDATDRFAPSFALGALLRPAEQWELGLFYGSRTRVNARGVGNATVGDEVGIAGFQEVLEPITDPGQARCGTDGRIGALAVCVDVTLPQIAAVGGRWILVRDGQERADLELDVRWEDWSAADVYGVVVDGKSGTTGIPLQPVNLRHGTMDAWSFRLGGSYRLDLPPGRLGLMGGVAYDTAAVPTSWTRVDFDGAPRVTLATGVSFDLERYRFALSGAWVIEPSRSVALCAPPDGPSPTSPGCYGNGQETPVADRTAPDPAQPLNGETLQAQSPFNAGRYESGYLLLSFSVSAKF